MLLPLLRGVVGADALQIDAVHVKDFVWLDWARDRAWPLLGNLPIDLTPPLPFQIRFRVLFRNAQLPPFLRPSGSLPQRVRRSYSRLLCKNIMQEFEYLLCLLCASWHLSLCDYMQLCYT